MITRQILWNTVTADISQRDFLTLNSLGEPSQHPFFTKIGNTTKFSSNIRAVLAGFLEGMYSYRSKKCPSTRISSINGTRNTGKVCEIDKKEPAELKFA